MQLGNMGILIFTWGMLAVLGGLPAIVALACNVDGRWRKWATALALAPYWALISTQWIWPIGGLSNFAFNLLAMIVVVFIAQGALLLPQIRRGPIWPRILLFVVVLVSTIPVHLSIPPMPD